VTLTGLQERGGAGDPGVAPVEPVMTFDEWRHPRTWIYFVQSGGPDGPVKIGRANDPARRLRELRTAHWEPLRLVAVLRAHPDEERHYHAEFAHANIVGEWFDATPDLLDAINAFAFLHAADLERMVA
jgi:hypothetical protein